MLRLALPAGGISYELPDELNSALVSQSSVKSSLVVLRVFKDHRHHTPAVMFEKSRSI